MEFDGSFPGEKLIIHLWHTLADNGIGNLLKPWQMRREAKAEAENMLLLSQAEKYAKDIEEGKKQLIFETKLKLTESLSAAKENQIPELKEAVKNITSDMMKDQIRREINLSQVILNAEDELKQDSQNIPTETIDEDWIRTWRDNASRSSKEYIQLLWGKVLAGEFKSPGSFSFRTLEFLKMTSLEDAKFISSAFQFVVNNRILLHDRPLLRKYDFSTPNRLKLQELGLVVGAEGTLDVTYGHDEIKHIYLISGNKALRLTARQKGARVNFKQCRLTSLGKEIYSLGTFSTNDEYLNSIALLADINNFSVTKFDYDIKTGRFSNGNKF